MMLLSLALVLTQVQPLNLNVAPILCMDEGGYCHPQRLRAFELNCSGAGISCAQTSQRMIITVGSSNPTVSCVAGEALTWNGSAWACVSNLATATALQNNPTDCGANQYAHTIAASGNLTCSQVTTAQLSGTITDGQLASNYSGVGACGANQYAHTLVDNGAPTCSQVTTAQLSGTITDAQLASSYSGVGACGANTFATSLNDNAAPSCSVVNDATGAVTGGIRLTTDLGGTAAAPTVVDDSHNHTGTTISALDTSDTTTGVFIAARGALGAVQPTCGGGDFLTCNGTVCSCATPAGGSSPLTTKGDLYTFTTLDARKPVGTDGQCLKALASEATGLEWGACAAGGSGLTYAEVAAASLAGF